MTYPIIRPVKNSDLEKLIEFAETSGYGITSLPRNAQVLERKIEDSKRSLQKEKREGEAETYLFCLELDGKVIGTSGIVARVGYTQPFFAYHLLTEVHDVPHLGFKKEVPLLHFTQARRKPTEIGTLFLDPHYRRKHLGKLLSFSRFLFIASFRERFASLVIAELRGVNHEGNSPFWEGVGRHFFEMDFKEADMLRAEYPICVEEIMPKHPLYVELLPTEARNVIGIPHSDTKGALRMLESQGFKMSQYVDLFDAGPHLYAYTEEIDAICSSQILPLIRFAKDFEKGSLAFIANTKLDYRASFAPCLLTDEGIVITAELASALSITIGDPIRYYEGISDALH